MLIREGDRGAVLRVLDDAAAAAERKQVNRRELRGRCGRRRCRYQRCRRGGNLGLREGFANRDQRKRRRR
jgi:hypothetical protein